jgi:hypothetical protein
MLTNIFFFQKSPINQKKIITSNEIGGAGRMEIRYRSLRAQNVSQT